MPQREEIPPDSADLLLTYVDHFPAEEREHGPAMADKALELFTGPVEGSDELRQLCAMRAIEFGGADRVMLLIRTLGHGAVSCVPAR